MNADLLERIRRANPLPVDPPAPPIEPVLERLDAVAAGPGARKRTRWRSPSRRTALLLLAGLAIAVPALAATQPWQPILGRPSLHDTPAGISHTPPPAAQLQLLGVLRRPQDQADRGPIAQTLLSHVGSEYKGVRLDSVRLLTASSGRHALLVPAAEHGLSPQPGKYEVTNDLCVEYPTGDFCGSAEQIRDGYFMGATATDLLGLVPDGVAAITLHFPNGTTLTEHIRDNFFWVSGVPHEKRTYPLIPHRKGMPRTLTHEEPELPRIEWFDSHGKPIGPPSPLMK